MNTPKTLSTPGLLPRLCRRDRIRVSTSPAASQCVGRKPSKTLSKSVAPPCGLYDPSTHGMHPRSEIRPNQESPLFDGLQKRNDLAKVLRRIALEFQRVAGIFLSRGLSIRPTKSANELGGFVIVDDPFIAGEE